MLTGRTVHYLLLLIVGSALFLPNLGSHSLWDIDESHNAECAREMMAADNWRVPTFNFTLRTDKPVLQYWLIIQAYKVFGVNEFAARFWSAICGLGSVLVTYEIGRRMFDEGTGLLAGIILASSLMFCVSSHAATPDALLIFFSVLTLCLFWQGYSRQRQSWLIWMGVTTGLAVLAKGPVGWLLPATTIGLFLLWQRQLRLLWDRRLLAGMLLFAVIVLPWYILVGIETRNEFLKGFLFKHNVGRFMSPMEKHGGPIFYHPLALLAGFAPWSAFLGLTTWYSSGRRAREDKMEERKDGRVEDGSKIAVLPSFHSSTTSLRPQPMATYRFLWCWIFVWLGFFSLAGTKLPNYILPAYPAVALLTARFLVRWQRGSVQPSPYLMNVCLACLGVIGAVIGTGLLLASGFIDLKFVRGRELPALAPWALAGLIPLAAGLWGWWQLRQNQRRNFVISVVISCTAFVGLLAGVGPVAVDAYKVPSALAAELLGNQVEREVQIGCYRYYQPALVFYTQRQVQRLNAPEQAIDLVHSPLQTFLVVPAEQWDQLAPQIDGPHRIVARRRDFMTGRNILLITNRL